MGVLAIRVFAKDQGVALEVTAGLDYCRVEWVSHQYSANVKLQRRADGICASGKIHNRWLAGSAQAVAGTIDTRCGAI